MEFTARQIAEVLNGAIEGNPGITVNKFSKIEEGKPGTLTFLANPKYEHYIYDTEAGIVLVNADFVPTAPVKATLIRVPNAYAALATLLEMTGQAKGKRTGIDPSAFISDSANIGAECYVGPFAYIGENVVIGDGCCIYPYTYVGDEVEIGSGSVLYPHATVYSGCRIGHNCILHAGCVIGSDGFGFAPDGETYKKIPQLGNVVIDDDVEIGANTTIDRAVIDSTHIRNGVKIDNLVQIGHNVEVGEHTVMAAQSGVAGSVKIGKHCRFGGQSGLAGHLHVGDGASIGAQTGIMSNVAENKTVFGTPALPARSYMRSYAIFNKLPELYATIGRLEKEIELLKKQ
jgi:UDP-3-O-[3-hydroxymyristoyl] glucosamine N-acyltransferase